MRLRLPGNGGASEIVISRDGRFAYASIRFTGGDNGPPAAAGAEPDRSGWASQCPAPSFCCCPPPTMAGVSIGIERGRQQNNRDGTGWAVFNQIAILSLDAESGAATLVGCGPAFPQPFTAVSLPFLDLPLPFHCLSSTFHCLSTAFHRPFTVYSFTAFAKFGVERRQHAMDAPAGQQRLPAGEKERCFATPGTQTQHTTLVVLYELVC